VNSPRIIPKLYFFLYAFILLNVSSVFGQFSGSATISGYKSTNVEGRDSATPDNVFNPSIDLLYNWEIVNPAALKFEATVTPNLFQVVKSRSFLKTLFSATGSIYLSDVNEDKKVAAHETPPSPKPLPASTPAPPQKTDTSKPVVILRAASADVAQTASVQLAMLSELLDSFEISKKGLSDDSSDTASDLKDSVSEAVLALSDILASQIFTESIGDVVTSELLNQKKIFSQVPMEASPKTQIDKLFDTILELLKRGKPQSDVLPTPIPKVTVEAISPISTASPPPKQNELLTEALTHLQSESEEPVSQSGKNAPLITLINSQTEFKDFSSQDLLLKEDLVPITKKTLATLLTLPVSLETQSNQGTYISYSYSEFEFQPRLDLYFGKNIGFGLTYDLTKIQFPFDTIHLNDGTENKFRIDTRIEGAPGFIITAEGGLSTKNYDDPLKYFVPVKGKPDKLVTTASDYSHYFIGGGIMLFPAERFTLSIAATTTRSSSLRPYLIDSTLKALTGRSRIGGTQNDDEYSYDLTRETIISVWNIYWDMKLSFDLSYENRSYANQQIARSGKVNQKLAPVTVKRNDAGPQFGFDLSREFLFDSRLISLFNSFTPVFDIQSSNYTSTVKLFSYKDVTTTLSVEFGF
jgi:hypothetical protein